ncbi:MAG: YidC/Oxa1 family membrane protein insertase [Eubacteriales bacterium]|nr:YidC/Oxa1 family membrane protein insertase [Eubacteriales bacterium]MDY4435432.1 YidC/Oxa1 family membrane protein insertase [Candidatus Flemingibacterium sp.]
MSSIWDTIINRPLGWIIEISYRFTHNYAIALFIFALVLQIVLFPLGIKQQKNSVKQASLRPKEMAIRKKYAGRNDKPTQQKLNEEIMELYQRENFNPMGGCLPMLIQLPILFSLYNVVISPLKYICGFGAETIKNIQLKVYEILQAAGTEGFEAFAEGKTVSQINLITKMRELGLTNFVGENGQAITESMLPDFTIFGGKLDLSMIPIQHLWSILLLIPALTLVVTYGSTWISRKLMYNPNPEAQNDISMKIMNLSMPLLSVYISFTVPATIGLYWIFRSILGVLQQLALSKMFPIPKFSEEDYKAAEREANFKALSKNQQKKQKVRSLHHIDDDDYEQPEQPVDKKPQLKDGVDKKNAPVLKEDKPSREEKQEDKPDDKSGEDNKDNK